VSRRATSPKRAFERRHPELKRQVVIVCEPDQAGDATFGMRFARVEHLKDMSVDGAPEPATVLFVPNVGGDRGDPDLTATERAVAQATDNRCPAREKAFRGIEVELYDACIGSAQVQESPYALAKQVSDRRVVMRVEAASDRRLDPNDPHDAACVQVQRRRGNSEVSDESPARLPDRSGPQSRLEVGIQALRVMEASRVTGGPHPLSNRRLHSLGLPAADCESKEDGSGDVGHETVRAHDVLHSGDERLT
jgi:hypothetical protein